MKAPISREVAPGDERLRSDDAKAVLPVAESLQRIKAGIEQIGEEEPLEILRRQSGEHAEPVADHPRDDIDRGGNETETCSPGDFENPVLAAVAEEVVLAPSPVKGSEGFRIN